MLQGIRPVFKFNVVIMSIYLIKRGENMFKKIITAVLATLMLLIVLPTKVFAEEIVHDDSQIVEIRDIPSIDPVVGKLEVSNSEETIVVEFNEITNELKIDGTTYKPTWWPGNPNPQPGTEDYLFQHYSPNFGSSASKPTVSACLVSMGIDLTKSVVKAFFKTGPWNLKRFVVYFGVALAESYITCLITKGITH